MKKLLAKANREVVAQFAWSKVLLAFDFDGTLAPIVADRDVARMAPLTARRLAAVAKLYPVAIISGRSRADVSRRLRHVAVKAIVGNHGMELSGRPPKPSVHLRRLLPPLEALRQRFPGLDIEDKRLSVAVHFRRCRSKGQARRAVEALVGRLGLPIDVFPGKQVMNLVPKGAPHKGHALETLLRRLRLDTAVYVGDDVTDEDVFALERPGRLLGVRVGASHASRAEYYLQNQGQLDELLADLIRCRWRRAPP